MRVKLFQMCIAIQNMFKLKIFQFMVYVGIRKKAQITWHCKNFECVELQVWFGFGWWSQSMFLHGEIITILVLYRVVCNIWNKGGNFFYRISLNRGPGLYFLWQILPGSLMEASFTVIPIMFINSQSAFVRRPLVSSWVKVHWVCKQFWPLFEGGLFSRKYGLFK